MSARLQFRSDEVSHGLFQALGTRLLAGRFFSSRDGPESPRVAIVNDALARRLWPGGDTVGRSIVIGFGAVALLMAAIGICGLIQYAVSTRTKEIAIRMAVGADTRRIFRMVVGEGLTLSGAGVTLGLLGCV